MANITLRRNPESAIASRPSLASFPSGWGRVEPFRLMEDLLRWDPFRELSGAGSLSGVTFSPDFEIQEMQDRYVFKGDLPGLEESDIDISVSGNRLTIGGKREAEQKDENANYYCYERSYGSFSRSFTLPQGADVEHIRADLKNGVLTVDVPKVAQAQPRKIALESGDGRGGKAAHA